MSGPPVITITAETQPWQADRMEEALIAAGVGLYQRAGVLVRLGKATEKDRRGREFETIRIVEVTADHMQDLAGRIARWERYDVRAKKYLPAGCPMAVVKGYIARGAIGWRVPRLAGVIHTPTLRRNGTVLDQPGYDGASELYFDPRGETFPPLPDQITETEARAALGRLNRLLAGFPFVDGASKAVALSAMLTGLIRPSIPAAPMHGVTAPTYASGKSHLVDLMSVLATSDVASPIACGPTDEELEKRVAAALIAGKNPIVIDNVDRPFNGALINQALTQERVSPRRLGKSENVTVDCTAVFLVNGNNLVIHADMVRRVVMCSLDTKLERPELRRFAFDPVARVRANRGPYVADGLTIIRYYAQCGRPLNLSPIAGFEDWSAWIRAALITLGEDDPLDTMAELRAADPEGARLAAVMGQWAAVIGNDRVTVKQVLEDRMGNRTEFREALLAVAGDHGSVNGERLGNWLRGVKNRITGKMHFERGKLNAGASTWVLVGAPEAVRADTDDLANLL